jgi:hypothetical protein
MKKLKKWAATIFATIMFVSTLTIAETTSKVEAAGSCGPGVGNGNGILEPGETCDVTPTVKGIHFQTLHYRTWNYRNRTVNFKVVRTSPRRVFIDYYLNYKPHGYFSFVTLDSSGTYQMEMRCTTGRTVYRDCHASAWFTIGWYLH